MIERRWKRGLVLLTAAWFVGCGGASGADPVAEQVEPAANGGNAGSSASSSDTSEKASGTTAGSAADSSTRPASAAASGVAAMPASGAAGGKSESSAGSAGSGTPAASETPTPAAGQVASEAGREQVPTEGGKTRRAVSADFLNQTLSVVDIDKLVEGATKDDALLGTVDLSMYVPGPLAIAVTPDGKTAIASITGGWLRLLPEGSDVPAGAGTLVFVDLETLKVKGNLDVGTDPMGIAITHDGKYAFVGLMSESYMAYVDIEKMSYMPIPTGNQWNEELSIDDTGTIGVLTTGVAGDSLSFDVAMPTMNGQTRGLSGDAGGVAFFPGSKFAFVVQAPTQLTGLTGGYNVLDLSNPSAPMATDNVRTMGDMNQAYPAIPVPSRKSVVYPSSEMGSKKTVLHEMGLEGGKAKLVQDVAIGESTFVYGLGATPDGVVLAASGAEHQIFVVDLNTGKAFTVPWGTTKTGPQDIKFIP